MHQPITIARVRKATKITVPAGGYIVLVAPNVSFTKHAGARMKLAASDMNEIYSEVICGRIDNKYRDLKFSTEAEKTAAAKAVKDAADTLAKNVQEAKLLQKKRDAEAADKKAAEHKKALAKVNAENDAIANRKFPGANHLATVGTDDESDDKSDETGTLKQDGPTVEEYVAANYDPRNYPPQGYAAKSTPEEVAKAIESFNQAAAAKNPTPAPGAESNQ